MFDMTKENFLNSTDFDVFTFGRPPISIDLMTEVRGLQISISYLNKEVHDIQEISVNVLPKEDLIKAKRASNRSKDKDDIEHLG